MARQAERILASVESTDAQSKQVSILEGIRDNGQSIFLNLSEIFDAAQNVLITWRTTLAGLQDQADGILARARHAQTELDGVNLTMEVLAQSSPGGLASLPNAVRISQLSQEKNQIINRLNSLQGELDQLRETYSQRASQTAEAYRLEELTPEGQRAGQQKLAGVQAASVKLQEMRASLEEARLETMGQHTSDGPLEYGAFLKELANASPEAVKRYFDKHPTMARNPLRGPGDSVWEAATVKKFWTDLGPARRKLLQEAAPGMIGNLNGVPYAARDVANRILANQLMRDHALSAETRETVRKLVIAAGSTGSLNAKRFIMSLDISNLLINDGYSYNDIFSSISIGDVDTAARTTILVPGMNANVSSGMRNLSDAANSLFQAQSLAGDRSHAVIAWMGYESPQLSNSASHIPNRDGNHESVDNSVLGSKMAVEGGKKLAEFYDGLNVTKSHNREVPIFGSGNTNEYNDPFISLNLHSYGTTTGGFSLMKSKTKVDNVVFYDSAGLDKRSIDQAREGEWQVEKTGGELNVFYTQADLNESAVARSGALASGRILPNENTIPGSKPFSSKGGFDATGKYLEDTDTHDIFKMTDKNPVDQYKFTELNDGDADGFLSQYTSSLYYGARISLGKYEIVDQDLIVPEVSIPGLKKWLDPTESTRDGHLSEGDAQLFAHMQGIEPNHLLKIEGNR
jgi:hypothetical protein